MIRFPDTNDSDPLYLIFRLKRLNMVEWIRNVEEMNWIVFSQQDIFVVSDELCL